MRGCDAERDVDSQPAQVQFGGPDDPVRQRAATDRNVRAAQHIFHTVERRAISVLGGHHRGDHRRARVTARQRLRRHGGSKDGSVQVVIHPRWGAHRANRAA